jgi:hypothetical protein
MKNGAHNLNERIKIGVWRHCVHVIGNGGSRLEQIIRKSNHFVKNLELSYLENDPNLFSHGPVSQMSAGRKYSDSGYSS